METLIGSLVIATVLAVGLSVVAAWLKKINATLENMSSKIGGEQARPDGPPRPPRALTNAYCPVPTASTPRQKSCRG
jgi:hypothetical protein